MWPCFKTINNDHTAVKKQRTQTVPYKPASLLPYVVTSTLTLYMFITGDDKRNGYPNVDSAGEQEGLFKLLSLVSILSLTWVSTITVLYLSQSLTDASWEAIMYSNTPQTPCLLQKLEGTSLRPHQTVLGSYS